MVLVMACIVEVSLHRGSISIERRLSNARMPRARMVCTGTHDTHGMLGTYGQADGRRDGQTAGRACVRACVRAGGCTDACPPGWPATHLPARVHTSANPDL